VQSVKSAAREKESWITCAVTNDTKVNIKKALKHGPRRVAAIVEPIVQLHLVPALICMCVCV